MMASTPIKDEEAIRLLGSEAFSRLNELPVNYGLPNAVGGLWDLPGSFDRLEHVPTVALEGGMVLPHVITLTSAPTENGGNAATGGAPLVDMSTSLVRLPCELPIGQTYFCFIAYRNMPTEQQAGGCEVQLSVGELKSFIPIEFEHIQASRSTHRPADCEWRVLAVCFTKQADSPPLYLRINVSSGRTAGLQVTMPVVVEARRFTLWSHGLEDVVGEPQAQPALHPSLSTTIGVHVVVPFPIKGQATHLRQSVKAQLAADGRSDVLVLDSRFQYNGQDALTFEHGTEYGKLALERLPHVLEELRWWAWGKLPSTRHIVLVSPGLVGVGREPALLEHFASLTVATLDAEEANRWLHIVSRDAKVRAKGNAALQSFLTSYLGALHAAALQSSLSPRRYRVVCLGGDEGAAGLMTVLEARRGGKMGLLQRRREAHGRAILEQVDGLPADQLGWPIADLRMMEQRLAKDQRATWEEEWSSSRYSSRSLVEGLAAEVNELLTRQTKAPTSQGIRAADLEHFAMTTRGLLADLPSTVRVSIAGHLLGFNAKLDLTLPRSAITEATTALDAGHHGVLATMLDLLLHLLDAAEDHVTLAFLLDSAPGFAGLLERVITSASAEPVAPTGLPLDHPGVLAAVGLLARLGNVVWLKVGMATSTAQELLKNKPQLLEPVYVWLGRLTTAPASSGGDVLKKTLSSVAGLLSKKDYSVHMVPGLTPSAVQAIAHVIKLTLGTECSSGIKGAALALLDAVVEISSRHRALPSPVHQLLDDEDVCEALRGVRVPACTDAEDAMALKAAEVLTKILAERREVRLAVVKGLITGEGAATPAAEEAGSDQQAAQPAGPVAEAQAAGVGVEGWVVRCQATQGMLQHYTLGGDDMVAAAIGGLDHKEWLQCCLAEQVKMKEEEQRRAEEAEAEAEEVRQMLRDVQARLAQAERQARRAAAAREEAAGGAAAMSQEVRRVGGTEVSAPMSELALELQLQGLNEAVRGKAAEAKQRYKQYAEDRQPIVDAAKANEVIETVKFATDLYCQQSEGFEPESLVELLGPAQYSSPEQFLSEVLQNFGDCRYSAGHGHVEITLGSKAIMLSADEEGFSAADVRAVCAIGKSTKKKSANQTGRKGIGFKSVFLVTYRPLILSGPALAMAFGRSSDHPPEPLEMLMPQVASPSEVPSDLQQAKAELEASGRRYTHLVLPIRPDLSPAELRQQLWSSAYDMFTLLTLDRLRQVRIRKLPAEEGEAEEVQTFSREGPTESVLPWAEREVLLRFNDGVTRMKVFDVHVSELEEEAARYNRRPVLRFAFPLDPSSSPQQADGTGGAGGRPLFSVYASLPVAEPVALPFVLQADWDVTTNRDRITATHPWNVALFAHLGPALLRLFAHAPFFKEQGGRRRIADSLPLREEMRGRGRQAVPGRWVEFVRAVQEGVREAGLLRDQHQQRLGASQWVADAHMQRLVPSCLWASVDIDLLPSSSSSSSPELLRLLGVRQLGWAELARLLAHAEQAGTEDSELGQWLEGLRGQRFEPVFAYLSATKVTAQISRLAASGSTEDETALELWRRFRDRWSKLRIFGDAASGEYRSFDPRRLALLQPRDGHDAELCRVLVAAGVAVLAPGVSEAERQLHSALGLQPATASHVGGVVLRVSCAPATEAQAADVDDEQYWGYLRILAHLLETKAVLPSDPRLMQVWLRCRGGDGTRRCKRVEEGGVRLVRLPSVLGRVLPSEAVEAGYFLADGFGASATWQGCSTMDLEVLLARLGCGLPRWKGRVEVDVSGLFGRDVSDVLEAGPYSGLSDRLLVHTTHGPLPPSDAFMPHVVLGDEEELPVVLLAPAIPASACMPGQPLYAALTSIGVQRVPTPRYFLRSIQRVVKAESAAELGGQPVLHGLAVEGSLCRLKLRLVDRQLRCLRDQNLEEVKRAAERLDDELELPCEGVDGEEQAVAVDRLFLLDAPQEMGLAEPVRAALPLVVTLLGGARAASQGNAVYLHHWPILQALGAQTALEARHVVEAIDALLAPGQGGGVVGLEERAMVLYRCLDHMLGELGGEGGDIAALVSRVRLPTKLHGYVQAASCSLPIADPFKQLLGEVRSGNELPRVSPRLLELGRLLSHCARDETRFGGKVTCDLAQTNNDFLYAHALSTAITEELSQTAPMRLELALVGDFSLRHTDMPEGTSKHKGWTAEPVFMLLKGYRLAKDAEGRAVLEAVVEETEGVGSVVALLRVSLMDYGRSHQRGDLSTAFTHRLHAALAALLESQQPGAMTTAQAREAAEAMVRAVHGRLPSGILPESLGALGMPERGLVVSYDAIVLPRPEEDLQQYLSLRWWQPGQARGGGEEEWAVRKGGELTREQNEWVRELGRQAELHGHGVFTRTVEGYKPKTCWVSENKALVFEEGADLGTVDEAAGHDFRLRINGRTVVVEVKGTTGSAANARVLMSQNQLDRMQAVAKGRGDADAYLVMVVGHVGRPDVEHRFFTPEQVQELRTTQWLCKVTGAGHDDVRAALESMATQRQVPGQATRHQHNRAQDYHHPQQREERGVRGSDARQYYPEHQPHRGRDVEEERGGARAGPTARYQAPHRRNQSQQAERPRRPSEERQVSGGPTGQQQEPRRDRPDHDTRERRDSSDGSEASSRGSGGRAAARDGRMASFGDDREADGSWWRGGAGQGSTKADGQRERRLPECMAACHYGMQCWADRKGTCSHIHEDQQCPGCGKKGGH